MADSSILDRVRDTAGLYEHVLREVRGDPTDDFYTALVDAVAADNAITINDAVKKDVVARLKLQGLEIGYNRPEAQVLSAIQDVREESPWADKITKFAPKIEGGIPVDVRERMLAYLQPLPVDPETANAQTVNTYLTLAYEESTRKASSSSDPIALTRPVGAISAWDYRIDPFDDVDYQVILASSIRAAGALAWVYEIGERLGVFKLADTLVMRWATGNVDFSSPTLVSQLYRYWQLRDDRMSPEDRGLLYRRVLSVGNTKVVGKMVINEDFPKLWRKLMEEATKYIEKEEKSSREDVVSRSGVYSATRELQYNLTEHMAGMGLVQVTEMYNQLHQPETGSMSRAYGAIDLLNDPEVVSQLSIGRRRNVWSVIERLSREEFNVAPNVSAIKTSAFEGNRIFGWIADFKPEAVQEDAFRGFLDASSSWILAQASLGDEPVKDEEDEGDEEQPDDEQAEDLEDWDAA